MEVIDNKEVGERMRWLEDKIKPKSRRAWAKSLDVDPSFFDKIVKGIDRISPNILKSLEEINGVNVEWLKSGNSEPFLHPLGQTAVERELAAIKSSLKNLEKGQGEILDQHGYTRREIRGIAQLSVFQGAQGDREKMLKLWELYDTIVNDGAIRDDETGKVDPK